MKDHVFIGELRKRISVLEGKHEELGKELNAARTTLAMFERESASHFQSAGTFSQSEIIADIVINALFQKKEMHRADIRDAIVLKGIHIGYDNDKKKQLASVSTLLSKDARFKPVEGKSGYWTLAQAESVSLDNPHHSGDVSCGSTHFAWEGGMLRNGVMAGDGITPIGYSAPLCQSELTLEEGFGQGG